MASMNHASQRVPPGPQGTLTDTSDPSPSPANTSDASLRIPGSSDGLSKASGSCGFQQIPHPSCYEHRAIVTHVARPSKIHGTHPFPDLYNVLVQKGTALVTKLLRREIETFLHKYEVPISWFRESQDFKDAPFECFIRSAQAKGRQSSLDTVFGECCATQLVPVFDKILRVCALPRFGPAQTLVYKPVKSGSSREYFVGCKLASGPCTDLVERIRDCAIAPSPKLQSCHP